MHNPFTKSKKEKEENTLATLQVLLFQLGSFFVFFFPFCGCHNRIQFAHFNRTNREGKRGKG